MGREANYLNMIKAICDKHTGNVIFNGEKLKAFLIIRNKANMSISPKLFNIGLEVLGHQRRKRNKRNLHWKRKTKTIPFCRGHGTLPKDTTRKLSELIS